MSANCSSYNKLCLEGRAPWHASKTATDLRANSAHFSAKTFSCTLSWFLRLLEITRDRYINILKILDSSQFPITAKRLNYFHYAMFNRIWNYPNIFYNILKNKTKRDVGGGDALEVRVNWEKENFVTFHFLKFYKIPVLLQKEKSYKYMCSLLNRIPLFSIQFSL